MLETTRGDAMRRVRVVVDVDCDHTAGLPPDRNPPAPEGERDAEGDLRRHRVQTVHVLENIFVMVLRKM